MHELSVMCGSMAMLLMLVVFVSAGVPSKVYAWIIYVYPVTYTPVTTGGYTTISWNAPTSDRCSIIGPTLPCISGFGGIGSHLPGVSSGGSYCSKTVEGANGSVYTGPINAPTTYTISCANDSGGWGSSEAYGSNSITVYPTPPAPPPPPPVTPTTLTSFTATPNSFTGSGRATLAWNGTKGTKYSACQLVGGQWGSGTWFSALPGSIQTNALTATTNYSMACYNTDGTGTGWRNATVTVTPAPLGVCNDIPLQASVPSGCVTPVPAPGVCTPNGGSYSASSNTCACPAGKHLSGTTCVVNPLCSNGLNNSYAPSCTCPSGQYQPLGVSSCVALPVCTNGLDSSYSPSCTCPGGQVQAGGGATCVPQGSIISFTANPSRVLAGRPASITWSTSHMSSCSVSAFAASGTSVLSTALSSVSTPVVNSRTVFTLTCIDASSATYSSSVTVSLIPQTIEQ
jgi:hypothetical protein